MKEIELKLNYDAKYREFLIRQCQQLGFQLEDQVTEIDTYYAPSDQAFLKWNQALRVRMVSSDKHGSQCRITYKGPNQAEGLQMREELETDVQDGTVLKTILERLSFKTLQTVSKKRLYYTKDPIHICIDQVMDLGDYFELEIMDHPDAPHRIQHLLQQLNIPDASIEKHTYLELLLKRKE